MFPKANSRIIKAEEATVPTTPSLFPMVESLLPKLARLTLKIFFSLKKVPPAPAKNPKTPLPPANCLSLSIAIGLTPLLLNSSSRKSFKICWIFLSISSWTFSSALGKSKHALNGASPEIGKLKEKRFRNSYQINV